MRSSTSKKFYVQSTSLETQIYLRQNLKAKFASLRTQREAMTENTVNTRI